MRLPPLPGALAGAERPLQPLGGVRAAARRPGAAGRAGRGQGQGRRAHGRAVRRPHRARLRQPLHHLRLYITVLLYEVGNPTGV